MGIALALYVLLVLVGAPLLSWRTASSGLITTTPRTTVYRGAMATAWFLAVLGAGVCLWDGSLSPEDVGLTVPGLLLLLGATLATLAALAAGVALFGRLRTGLGLQETPEVKHLIPRTGSERRLYAGVSLTAGLTEEFVFRGIVLTALARLPGLDAGSGPWLAAVIVSVGFGLGHGYQDGFGMVRAGALGFLLAIPFLLTGSLVPGIIAHAAVDLSLLTPGGRALVGMDPDDAGGDGAGPVVDDGTPGLPANHDRGTTGDGPSDRAAPVIGTTDLPAHV